MLHDAIPKQLARSPQDRRSTYLQACHHLLLMLADHSVVALYPDRARPWDAQAGQRLLGPAPMQLQVRHVPCKTLGRVLCGKTA